jgi:uncharacterized membrane protein YgcG
VERAAATTLTGPAEALRDEEVERTRAFLRLGWLVAAGTVIAVLLVPGDRRIAAALLATLGLAVLGSLWLARASSARRRSTTFAGSTRSRSRRSPAASSASSTSGAFRPRR